MRMCSLQWKKLKTLMLELRSNPKRVGIGISWQTCWESLARRSRLLRSLKLNLNQKSRMTLRLAQSDRPNPALRIQESKKVNPTETSHRNLSLTKVTFSVSIRFHLLRIQPFFRRCLQNLIRQTLKRSLKTRQMIQTT